MFEDFSEEAQRVLATAQKSACGWSTFEGRGDEVIAENILHALVVTADHGDTTATTLFANLNVSLDSVFRELDGAMFRGTFACFSTPGFGAKSRRVLEQARTEYELLGSAAPPCPDSICLLLALSQDGYGATSQILRTVGISHDAIFEEAQRFYGENSD